MTLFSFQSISRLKSPAYLEFNRLEYSLKILYLMNSLVNPIVNIIRVQEFRKALLKALLKSSLTCSKSCYRCLPIGKNVARNHVNSSFFQRLPTVKLVWWHFLGLGNYDNTNNSVNSKNLYILLLVLSTINLYFKGSLM